jgi:hypothetical protein
MKSRISSTIRKHFNFRGVTYSRTHGFLRAVLIAFAVAMLTFAAKAATTVTPSAGSYAGGNTVVIAADGNLGAIINILVGGVPAAIQSATTSGAIITMPATGSAGIKDILIQTSDNGDITLTGAYTANPAGQIGSVVTGPYAWTNLDTGVNDTVFYGLVKNGNNLYAGGRFTIAGGVSANYVALWNGTSWSALGSGTDARVQALLHDGTNLYAAGDFTMAGGVTVNRVAKWDGTNWTALGGGVSDSVYSLATDGTNLYAGGDFISAGAVAVHHVAKWDGTNWTALGTGMNDSVRSLAYDGTNLYAGGMFTTANEISANRVAMWNGTTWLPVGSGMDGTVTSLLWDRKILYAGGSFLNADGLSATRVAKWDGIGWTAMGAGMDSSVYAFAVNGPNLYAGGHFTMVGAVVANFVAKWDGTSWSTLGAGLGDAVLSLLHDGTNLYAGGWFTTAGGLEANHMAQWGAPVTKFSGVEPASGSWSGGFTVTIDGSNLGNGADIYDVKICGTSVQSIESQSATKVVVVPGAGTPGTGDVRVFSTSYGETVKANAFTYTKVFTKSAGATTWAGNGGYDWEINSATGTAGTDPGWDLLDITGALNITATSGGKFNVNLFTLESPDNSAGIMTGFDNAQSYSWTIARASGGIIGFAPDRFNLNTNGFANDVNGGRLTLAQVGNEIHLNFSPAANHAPVAQSITAGTRQNKILTINASKLLSRAADVDGNTLTMTGVSASSASVTLTLASGVIAYTPALDFTGTDTFTYTISDGHGAAATATVTVTVTPATAASLNAVYGPVIIGGNFVVRFAGIPGYTYSIESTTILSPPGWVWKQNITAPTTAGSFGVGVFEFSEPVGAASAGFYRTVWPAH